jgi:hypothetical protein
MPGHVSRCPGVPVRFRRSGLVQVRHEPSIDGLAARIAGSRPTLSCESTGAAAFSSRHDVGPGAWRVRTSGGAFLAKKNAAGRTPRCIGGDRSAAFRMRLPAPIGGDDALQLILIVLRKRRLARRRR